jgi:hypothetical protein
VAGVRHNHSGLRQKLPVRSRSTDKYVGRRRQIRHVERRTYRHDSASVQRPQRFNNPNQWLPLVLKSGAESNDYQWTLIAG